MCIAGELKRTPHTTPKRKEQHVSLPKRKEHHISPQREKNTKYHPKEKTRGNHPLPTRLSFRLVLK